MNDLSLTDLSPRPAFYPAPQVPEFRDKDGTPRQVGIIMRTCDRPLLLHRALSSVLLQTHAGWRLYLVNDGGDRAELEAIIAQYEPQLDGRLVVIHHGENKGLERSGNAALACCREELIAIHDDDDSWHPEFLAEAASFLTRPENRRYIGVVTGCELIYETIEAGEVRETGRIPWTRARDVIDFRHMLVENKFPPICLMFHRVAIERIGGYNGEMRALSDWEFNIRLMLLGDIGFIDRPLARYHHRPKGTDSAYSNTVVDHQARHRLQNVRLRNAMLRAALAERPEMLGLIQPILHALHDIDNRLARMERAAGSGDAGTGKLPRKYLNRYYWQHWIAKQIRSIRKRAPWLQR